MVIKPPSPREVATLREVHTRSRIIPMAASFLLALSGLWSQDEDQQWRIHIPDVELGRTLTRGVPPMITASEKAKAGNR